MNDTDTDARAEALDRARRDFEQQMASISAPMAYEEALGRDGWGAAMIRLIPSHMHNGLARYIVSGRLPGSFLRAVLRGELFEAVGRADDINRERLVDYVIFLHNYAPTGCYGSAEHVSGWVFDGGILGPRLGEAK